MKNREPDWQGIFTNLEDDRSLTWNLLDKPLQGGTISVRNTNGGSRMNKKIKYIMVIIAGIIAVAFTILTYGRTISWEEAARTEYQADGKFMITGGTGKISGSMTAAPIKEGMLSKIWQPIKEIEQIFQEPPYYIEWDYVWAYTIAKYGVSPQMEHTHILQVGIPDDKEKEERINALILGQCDKVLPKTQGWIENVRLQLLYCSERYLCFQYLENAFLPEDYNTAQLYFTIDMEKEKLLEYPVTEDTDWFFGDLHEEQEIYGERPIEEQDALRGDAGYGLYEKEESYSGVPFPCIQIEDLEDAGIQEDINAALQEPLINLIGTYEDAPNYIATMKMYVACKTSQWLSVVYTFKSTGESKRRDGYSDIGVTVNMETGERYMLDDLVDMDEFLMWICMNSSLSDWRWKMRLVGSMLTEKELIDYYNNAEQKNWAWFESGDWPKEYGDELYSFYLYPGKLVIMKGHSGMDIEIPLPEIYQCLLVDPWYE